MFLLSILSLPNFISATLGGNDWFQHPSRVASENNGTNTKIHCQRFREAEQVNWWFKPAGERSWRTVKMYSKQDLSHVTKYDKYDRYSIDNRLGQYEGRVVYFYDLLIEPVTWADRGEWKCEFPDADIQSSPGKLNVDIPLTGVSFSSNGREYTNSTRGAPLVIDEGDDLTIWCRTSETFPSPKGLEIWIDNEKLKNVQIQTHTKSDGLAQMSGSAVLKSVNRENYHEKNVYCIGQWSNSSSPDAFNTIKGVAMINVFFPAMDLLVRTEEVEFNRQLQAKCTIGQPANPKPEIIWYLDGKMIGNEQELKYDVERSDDLKELKCVAIHKTFAREPREIKQSSSPTKIRVHYHSEPSSLTITKNEIESKIEFECITGRAYPHSVISMQIRSPSDEIIPYGSSIAKLKKIQTLDGGYIVKRVLTLDGNNLNLHNSEVVCIESWRDENEPDFTQEAREQIKINHAPKSVKVEGINNLTIGRNEILCFADGGYPQPNIDQFQMTIGRKIIPLSPSDVNNGVVANVNLTLEDHNKTIKCSLSNSNQKSRFRIEKSMKTEEKLNITYPVTDINMSLDKDIYDVNEVVQIEVMTSSSYPKPVVSCYKEAISKSVVALESISNPLYEEVEPYGSTYRAVFTFQATRFDDGAIISCRTINNLDAIDKTVEVQRKLGVLTKAFFVSNQVFEVAEGKKLSIPVERLIRSNPSQQEISWYKISDKKPLVVGALADQSGLELTIDDVTRDHNGEYFVQSEDVSGIFNLIVLTAPKIRISGSTSVISGQNLDLTCYGEGIPAPKVYWVRDDVILSNGTELYIEAPNERDSGDYFCVASNSHSTSQKSIQVQIQYAPQLEVNSEIVVYPGDKNFPLECTVKALPPVEEVFFVSPDGEKFMSTFSGGDRWTLTKWSPTLTAFGTWNCQAENKVNRVQANIEVIQAGPPEGIKDLTIDIIPGASSSIKLKWSKGRSNGYEQKFRVRVKSADLAIGFDKEYKTQNGELVVRNLTINTDYDINIIAENDKGQSLPYNQIYAFDGVNKQTTTLYIYLISISVLILLILVVVLFWHKKKEFKYNTRKLESDTDRSSLPESESLVKQERLSAEYQLQRPSSENSFADHRHSEGMYRYYTLQGNKRSSNLPDVAQLNHSMTSPNQFLNPDQLDYSPSGVDQSGVYDDHYGSTLCHRHHLKRNYDTMPKLIDTTSGYCSSSNSSQSQPVPRSQSFQHRRKTLKSEGVLV